MNQVRSKAWRAVFFFSLVLSAPLAEWGYADNGPNHQVMQNPLVLFGVQGGNQNDLVPDGSGCYIGTLGCLVRDVHGTYILSNNHVLARTNAAKKGEDIMHTASTVCVPESIHVGDLSDFVLLDFEGGPNLVDAAVALIDADHVASDGSIMDIGILTPAPVDPKLRMNVKKSGRTTGLTKSRIGAVGVNTYVDYGDGQVAYFMNQIFISGGNFSDSGDSGSLIVTDTEACPRPVALLFAGSPLGTVASPIKVVLSELGVAVVGLKQGQPCPSSGGGGKPGKGGGKPTITDLNADEGIARALAARDRYETNLMNTPGVVGTGAGAGEGDQGLAVEVYVEKITPALLRSLPRGLDGIPVRVVETGRFVKY